jgi:hypothetical protein
MLSGLLGLGGARFYNEVCMACSLMGYEMQHQNGSLKFFT